MKFRKKPVVIEAAQWFKNGDHPLDAATEMFDYPDGQKPRAIREGAVVRYYRHPDVPGERQCEQCGLPHYVHGWIDTLEQGHRVCPGDWIITGVLGERYPCKPEIFAATYESAIAAAHPAAPVAAVLPDADKIIELMHKAKDIAPGMTSIEPVSLTPIQVAWILGMLRSTPPSDGVTSPDAPPLDCHCEACEPNTFERQRMILCATCGNKRCPHATDHRNVCTASNEPGQKGSSWENYPSHSTVTIAAPAAQAVGVDTPELESIDTTKFLGMAIAAASEAVSIGPGTEWDGFIAYITGLVTSARQEGREKALEEAKARLKTLYTGLGGPPDDPHPDAVLVNGTVHDCIEVVIALAEGGAA